MYNIIRKSHVWYKGHYLNYDRELLEAPMCCDPWHLLLSIIYLPSEYSPSSRCR